MHIACTLFLVGLGLRCRQKRPILRLKMCFQSHQKMSEIKLFLQSNEDRGWGYAVLPLVVGQGGLLAYPEFGSSVNPIPTRGADYAHRITACPPGIENLAGSMHMYIFLGFNQQKDTMFLDNILSKRPL